MSDQPAKPTILRGQRRVVRVAPADTKPEHWTIYDATTGKIRVSGSGPKGHGALQKKLPGELILPERTLPHTHIVDVSTALHKSKPLASLAHQP